MIINLTITITVTNRQWTVREASQLIPWDPLFYFQGPKGENLGAITQPLPYSYLIFRAPSEVAGMSNLLFVFPKDFPLFLPTFYFTVFQICFSFFFNLYFSICIFQSFCSFFVTFIVTRFSPVFQVSVGWMRWSWRCAARAC